MENPDNIQPPPAEAPADTAAATDPWFDHLATIAGWMRADATTHHDNLPNSSAQAAFVSNLTTGVQCVLNSFMTPMETYADSPDVDALHDWVVNHAQEHYQTLNTSEGKKTFVSSVYKGIHHAMRLQLGANEFVNFESCSYGTTICRLPNVCDPETGACGPPVNP